MRLQEKELVRHAMQSENAGRLKAMIDVASNLERNGNYAG